MTKIIYIAGYGRSGSTLLEGIIQQKFKAVGVGEAYFAFERGFIRNELCSCGSPFRDCPFWSTVMRRAFGDMDERLAENYHRVLEKAGNKRLSLRKFFANPEIASDFCSVVRPLYQAIIAEVGSDVIIDSSKFPVYGAWLASCVEEVGWVHLFRDPRAVAASWQRVRPRLEAQGGVHAEMTKSRSVLTSGLRWSLYNRQCAMWLGDHPDAGVSLSYETLCADPEAISEQLASRFGLERRKDPGDAVWHSVSGNPSRFSGASSIQRDDGWRTELSVGQKFLMQLGWSMQYAALKAKATF